jgi:hypothetical protein
LTAEFPFGRASSLVQASLHQEHPRLGKGLWLCGSFDTAGIDHPSCADPFEWNRRELEHEKGAFFGSWRLREPGVANFVTFVPTVARGRHRPSPRTSSSPPSTAPAPPAAAAPARRNSHAEDMRARRRVPHPDCAPRPRHAVTRHAGTLRTEIHADTDFPCYCY